MNGRLEVFPTAAALARGAAERIAAVLGGAVLAGGSVWLVLSGGSTPRAVYELLAGARYRDRIPWEHLHVFWGDERCVPPGSPESNYRMAWQALLRHVPVPPAHVHRIHGELPPGDAARAYEHELRMVSGIPFPGIPRPALVLLGLGEDGHTASLFPGTPVLNVRERLVAEAYVERLGAWRVTMTLPLLNNARTVLFLVSGASKAAMLQTVVQEPRPGLPASSIMPEAGELLWYADRDAASHLSKPETI